ncbi:transcription antitermination factor NusB [Cyclobacteriaceae bacterium]|nr:transcription antitermination factor NusB [Cyclobacteriaceae bacterium]
MLNRRVLRVKAMQSLYSYFLMKASVCDLIEEELVAKYALDPALHDFLDRELFEAKQNLIKTCFRNRFVDESSQTMVALDEEDLQEVENSYLKYENLITAEVKSIRKNMMAERARLKKLYLKILLLPVSFAFVDKQYQDKIKSSPAKSAPSGNLSSNVLIAKIKEDPNLYEAAKKGEVEWEAESDVVVQWYKDVLRLDEFMTRFQELKEPTQEQQLECVQYLYKKVIFKSEIIGAYFDQNDLRWNENKLIIRSMVLKTLKHFDFENLLELQPLSHNEDEDFEYFETLFSETMRREYELEMIISKRAKNWDASRMAMTDLVILKMALAEMMTFPSIPIKVTINEYIEISKNYSTPRSKQFVNGILDVLANELSSEGIIKKSGRGLIDNK